MDTSKTQGMSAAEEAFHAHFLGLAIDEARAGLDEGGIPIGSVLVRRKSDRSASDAAEEARWSVEDYEVVGRGHNQRVQKRSATLHGEMDCLENAGRLPASDYARCILYSTLSPCAMCAGAALLYSIPVVVMGENATCQGPEAYVRSQGVRLINLDSAECRRLMADFIAAKPAVWNEDCGVWWWSSKIVYGTRSGLPRVIKTVASVAVAPPWWEPAQLQPHPQILFSDVATAQPTRTATLGERWMSLC